MLRTVTRCLVCGFTEIRTDEVVDGGVVLLAAAVVALIWANSPVGASYETFWETVVKFEAGPFHLEETLRGWVNDGLMVIFFLVVGMEIKRELVLGELSSLRRATLPVAGAIGGMVVPAGIYFALHAGQEPVRGWGVPMATDIAFAVAALETIIELEHLCMVIWRIFDLQITVIDIIVVV